MRAGAKGDPLWGVLDLSNERSAEWARALGTDALELDSWRPALHEDGTALLKVRVGALTHVQLARICRAMAARWRATAARIFFEAIQGDGLWIDSRLVFCCRDPDFGRAYYARRAEKGGDRA